MSVLRSLFDQQPLVALFSYATGVVLLPGRGFEVVDVSARVSLANLTDHEYAAIGRSTRQVLAEYHDDYVRATAPGAPADPQPAAPATVDGGPATVPGATPGA